MLATGRYAIDRSRYEGKEIAKPITPPSESASEEDSDPEQAHKDKDMQKNCLSLQSTSRNSTILNQLKLRTSSTLKNKECGYYSKEQSDWLARHREEIYDKCGSTFTVTWQRFWRYAKMLSNVMMRRELTECKSILAETRTLGESNSIRDSCLVALQNKQTGFERFKAFNDRTVEYDKLERRLNETLGLLAQKETDIKECLKVKAYEISVVKEKHDELVKQSLLTKLHYEGLIKEKTKVITDLKHKEEKDIDKMISMEHQLKFLNEIVYKRRSINPNNSSVKHP
ncbi:hypothetical protein Tco_1294227 [Tanacetum coccineum]